MSKVPQPRYSAEHKAQALSDKRPLFTLDIWYPGEKRSTMTGVLSDEDHAYVMQMLKLAMEAR